MSKKMEKAIRDLKGTKEAPKENIFAKAARNLASAAESLAKGAIDLDAKDFESGDYDANDTAPRRRGRRNPADGGNGWSGMEPTPAEMEEFDGEEEGHRVIVTGKPEVNGGGADDEEWEDPEEPNVGDPEWYHHTRGRGTKQAHERDPFYAKSRNEEDDDEEGDDEDENPRHKMHKKSQYIEDEMSKSEQAVYEELLESPDFAEIVESSPVVEHMANTMGKGFGYLFDKIESLEKGILAIMQAQHTLFKSLENTPVNNPALGVLGRIGDRNVEVGGNEPMQKGNMIMANETSKQWYRDTLIGIEHGVSAGDISADLLTKFDVNGTAVVKSIPEAIRTKHGIKLAE